MELIMILGGIVIFFGLIALSKMIYVIRQSETMVIERLGSFSKVLRSGMHFVVPFLDQPRDMYWSENGLIMLVRRLDMREAVMDVPSQKVITKDNVSIEIDALLYVQITDPVKVMYEINNLPVAVAQLAQTSLRNVIGEMDLDSCLVSRDTINAKLKAILDEATDKWGTKVNRVELKNITPPREIQVAMEKQMQAERERRAKVLEAEGDKQARISRSEGVRQEQINLAEGEREAQIRRAEGQAQAIKEVADAKREAFKLVMTATGNTELAAKYLVATEYIREFGNFVAGDGDKVFVPYEASTALGSMGTIGELLKAKG